MTPDRYLVEVHRRDMRRMEALIDLIDLIAMAVGIFVFVLWKVLS